MSVNEIKNQIKSIKSTQKITRAMEMVAASKMRKAQNRVISSRPYFEKIKDVISHLVFSTSDYTHPFIIKRKTIKNIGVMVISSDRGLCGGLNNNLFRECVSHLDNFQTNNIGQELYLLGKKSIDFFKRHKANISAELTPVDDNIALSGLIGVGKVMVDSFLSGEIDELYFAYNEFKSSMVQTPKFIKVLPTSFDKEGRGNGNYIYEPGEVKLQNLIFRRYFDSVFYQAVVENIACEQAARMIAMKSASDNAGELIDKFQLIYNKARQAAITQELAEIVAGADAV